MNNIFLKKGNIMKSLSNRMTTIMSVFAGVFLLSMSITPLVQAQYNNNGYNDDAYQNYDDGYGNNSYGNNDYGYSAYGDYREFYNDLAPYGQWLSDPQYGYVWAPYGGNDFRPYYTNGYWVMTEYGNTWVSGYPWGWAPFHYGRWAQSSYYGWIWIPGNTWGPAWVSWRQGGGYYGWAPMGPGISISISFGSGFNIPNPWWTFIPCGNIYAHNYSNYYAPRRTVNIINNTTIINNTYVDNRSRNTYVSGPRRTDIENVTHRPVNVYKVSNASGRSGNQIAGNKLTVYRPTIGRVSNTEVAKIAPAQVKRLDASAVTSAGGGKAPARTPVSIQQQQAKTNRNVTSGSNQMQLKNNQQLQQIQQTRSTQQVQQQKIQQQQAQQRTQQVQQQQVQQQRVQQQQAQQRIQQQQVQQQQVQQQRVQQQQAQQRIQQQQVQQQQVQQQRIQQQQVQQQQMQQQRIQQQQVQQQQAQQQRMQQQQVQQQQMQQQQRAQQQMQQRVQQQPAPQPQQSERSQQPARVAPASNIRR
jgi:hypothetical protein